MKEALEQQTATSEVLQVISRSPSELEPVFNAMLANATRICAATFGVPARGTSISMRRVHSKVSFVDHWRHNPVSIDLRDNPGVPLDRLLKTKQVVHIPDLRTDQSYIEKNDHIVALVEIAGGRTFVAVPMLKEGEVIGEIALYRQEVRPFTNKQIQLVTTFADQAASRSRMRGCSTSCASRSDSRPRQPTCLRSLAGPPSTCNRCSIRWCNRPPRFAMRKWSTSGDPVQKASGSQQAMRSLANVVEALKNKEYLESITIEPGRGTIGGRTLLEGRVIQVSDLQRDPEYQLKGVLALGSYRTALGVPLLREGTPIGVLFLTRTRVEAFTPQQVALVETFADQAVIAIENVRLFKELRRDSQSRAQSQEVVKLNQQLERRVADQVGEIERMGRLRRFLSPQVADLIIASGMEKQLESHRREITALFCDLRGFTGFSEISDPEDVMSLLRDYHAAIGEIIIKYNGTLEHYAGDGVMVIFNDPIPVLNPALQAVRMALDMRTAIGALIEKWHRLGHELGFGIGIAHGFATLGTIGFEGRFDYAAIGTVSNVASRLCDEAKPGQILISPRVMMAVEDAVTVEPVGDFALKGIHRPMAAYNVLSAVSSKI